MSEPELRQLIYEFCREVRTNASYNGPKKNQPGITFENEQVYFKAILNKVIGEVIPSEQSIMQLAPNRITTDRMIGLATFTAIRNGFAFVIEYMEERRRELGLVDKPKMLDE